MWLPILVGVLAGYMLGNINGAVIISALMNDDVRNHGSGNAGLTNFIRNYGTPKAILVIGIDAAKAILACLVMGLLLEPYDMYLEGIMIGGAAVILGHIFPALLGFHGGKGVLSGLFIAVVADWRIALLILAIFFVTYFITRYVSLGSVLASLGFAAGFCVLHHNEPVVLTCGIAIPVMAIFMHRSNIVRLCTGKERKTDLFKKEKSE